MGSVIEVERLVSAKGAPALPVYWKKKVRFRYRQFVQMEYKWMRPQDITNIDRERITKLSWVTAIIGSRNGDCSHPVYMSRAPTINSIKYAHLKSSTLCDWPHVWLKLKQSPYKCGF